MPWTKKDYPPAMKNLPVKVRNKAVEIANAILEEGKMDEGGVIAISISKAKDAVDGSTKKKADSKK
ncbi:hypothetical protein CLU83_0721 [Flavobacterium sp. 1]|uniref:hypothetical protein n=1 Tax=Flavobacterium sp. 1 TaxID=2035200 RepID=UPI000C2367D2|nr:hypothetical protein [Flavobacterium sp. 1]PJJ07547.1 hypothetical protein CLU83_0721 [Flavobacterium sp. 1]